MTNPSRSPPPATSSRIHSLDQFRGYTVAGMLLVNFVGRYEVTPQVLQHHNTYCSYADTIMPQFLFAVGFAFRLTFARRLQREGARAAYGRVIQRLLGLVVLSLVLYTPGAVAVSWRELSGMTLGETLIGPLKRDWFQTLMHIAVTSLWILPVVTASAWIRAAFLVASVGLHGLLSYWFNFDWVFTDPRAIDGGPLGFLTWCVPALVGTFACDAIVSTSRRGAKLAGLCLLSLSLMTGGWLLSCGTRLYDVDTLPANAASSGVVTSEIAPDPVWPKSKRWQGREMEDLVAEPPFVAPPGTDRRSWNYWMMCQRAGTPSYQIFAAGFSLAVYLIFYLLCDLSARRSKLFQSFGTNALAAYVLHGMVDAAVSPFIPRDAPLWYVASGVVLFFAITLLFVRYLEKEGIYLRL